MTPRAIIRDPDILDGRWHFAGTSIAVADVVRDHEAAPTGVVETYRFAGLTGAEVQVALLFAFPAVRGVGVSLEYGSVRVDCVCGEHTQKTGVWPLIAEVECPCRRTWRVTVEPAGKEAKPPKD
jgi:uncharacterized protein (DUF433 family)